MPALDLTGQRFGLLIAVEHAPNQNGCTMWRCGCDCGGEKVIRTSSLRDGLTKSCGCISGPLTKEKWISRARKMHGDKYDYSKVDYQGAHKEVEIICPIHRVFCQKAAVHSTMERGCPKCGRIKQAASQTYTHEDFLRLAGEVHGDRYDYSETEYKPRIGGKQEDVTIICRKHGPFPQKAHTHLQGKGCQLCKQELIKEILTKSLDQFIADARKIHGDRYDYSKVEYKGAREKVLIICPKHKPFRQTPDAHLNAKSGCGRCSESKGEKGIAEFLEAIEIEFELHKSFPDCKFKRRLPFDFYLPDYDALIEFDGQQHFERDYSWFKDPALSQKNFEMIQLRDEIKTEWAKTKKISLFRIRFDEDLQKRMCDICEELDIQI